MEITIGLYGKGNEIIFWHLLCVGSCLVLSNNCRCMCYHRRSTLHQIWTSWIGSDNVRQGSKTIFGDENIYLSSCVVGEKVRNLSLYVGSTFQYDCCNSISKCIMGAMCSFPHGQHNKWIP
jgi:hypothetical protein